MLYPEPNPALHPSSDLFTVYEVSISPALPMRSCLKRLRCSSRASHLVSVGSDRTCPLLSGSKVRTGSLFLQQAASGGPGGSGAEEAPKGPQAQGTRLNRAGAIASQGLVPSPKQGAGPLSTSLGPASVGAHESRQVELLIRAAGPAAVSAAVCIS